MATTTENLGLKNPSYEEMADIGVINDNMEIIDKAYGGLKSEIEAARAANGYVMDSEGNKYTMSVDDNGDIILTRIVGDMITENLAHDIHIEDGKIIDSVTGEDLTNSQFIEIDSTGKYIRVKSTANALMRFDALTDYTIELIGATEFDTATGDHLVLGILFNSSNWATGKISVGVRSGYKTYGYINYQSFQYTNYMMKDGCLPRHTNVNTEKSISNLVSVGVSVSKENASLLFAVQGKTFDYSDKLNTSEEFLNCDMIAFQQTNQYFKRIRIYDKAFTAKEFSRNFEADNIPMYGKTADGIVTLGPAVAFKRNNKGLTLPIDSKVETAGVYSNGFLDYTIRDFEYPEIDPSESIYTACTIYNKVSDIYVGDMIALSALPFPFQTGQTYRIEWATSDPNVIECVNGLLTAKTIGSATITATITGTNISDSVEITVSETESVTPNYCYIPEGYVYGMHALNSKNPVSAMTALEHAIDEAIAAGFNGVVFPKMDYYLTPVITNETYKRCILIMTDNFMIDFSGGTIYMQDNERCHCEAGAVNHSDGYVLFQVKFCENVVIKNLNYYGERTYKSEIGRTENEYTEFVNFLQFDQGATRCRLENVNFYNTVGFNISTGTQLFDNSYACGQIHAENLAYGHITDDLTVEDSTDCIHTVDYIELGRIGDSLPTRYRIGVMGHTLYEGGLTGRLYDLLWFDSDKNLIQIDKLNHQYDLYDVPENGAYFKVNAYQSTLPTEDVSDQLENYYVATMFGFSAPDMCRITNCNFVNPHASAISITGGQRFIIDHCYMEQGKRYTWSVDFEDGWLEMRHNVIVKNICKGNWIMCEGNGNHFQNNYLNGLDTKRYNENGSYVNNHIVNWGRCERYVGVDAYNHVHYEKDSLASEGWNTLFNQWSRDTSDYGY